MKSSDPLDVADLDYLNDIIPYRCPKCRDERKFSSLSDLHLHLDKNHSYQIGYVRPRTRTQVFDAKSAKTKENNSINEGKMKASSPRSRNRSLDGRSSPLLLSFKEDARILESQLKAAKEAEMRNKERSYDRKTGHVNESGTIDNLHLKLMSSRSRQWKAEEALYSIDSVLDNLEKSVEMRFRDQRCVISDLASSLDNREEQLSQANLTLKSLQKERQKLMRETQEVLQQSEIKNERLKLELERRDDVLYSVKSQLQDLRVKTEESIRLRDNELLLTKDRVHDLELEKETLMRDVEELMRASDQDSIHLKQALGTKERQLKLVNNELLKIRNEQSDLMNESVKLYEAAEMGNEKLKKVIQTKDSKLQQAEMELVKLRKMQDDLVSESQLLTEQADSHSQTMRGVLTEKEAALSTLRQELDRVIQERDRLLTAVETRVPGMNSDTSKRDVSFNSSHEQEKMRQELDSVVKERDRLFMAMETRAPGMNSEASRRDVPVNSSLEQEKMRQELERVVKERDRLLMALEARAPVNSEAHQRHVPGNSSSLEQEEMKQELERVMKERDRLMEVIKRSPVRGHVIERTSEIDGDNALIKEEKLIPRQNASQNQRVITPVLPVNDADISKLQSELEEKQAYLEMKERELESLKKFINTTAEKEMVGRQKLEEFISELIDRADQAERELDLMRRKSNDRKELQRSPKQNVSVNSPSNQMPSHNTSGTSGLYSSVARHLVEATVEPWPNSIAPSALIPTKKIAPDSNTNTKGEYIKSNVQGMKTPPTRSRANHPKESTSIRTLPTYSNQSSDDTEVVSPESKTKNQPRKSETSRQLAHQSSSDTEVMSPVSRLKHQPRKVGSDKLLPQQSSKDSEIMSDEDSTEYSPLPANKRYPETKKQFQRTNSNQSYISQRHGWMDPDSVLYSETMDDPDLERISVDSFNGLPAELHQISGGNPNVVYVPFNRKTGQPIRPNLDPTRHLDPNSDPDQQQNLDNDSTPNQLEASDKMESNKVDLSESSTYSHSEFKEIKLRESPDKGSQRGGTSHSKSESHTDKSSKPPKRCEQKQEKDREENVVMRSIGVMANIPSFQGTTTESESCEEMEMAENSLSDVKSFSEDYPLQKQDSFEKELDDNGIIWDLDDHSHQSLIESRRFSPYGSEMKSPSNQGGVIDESDSLDSIPVKDQSGESSEYHSGGLGETGLNSLSFNTYPPRRKQVNFQTLSEHRDPVNYSKRPNKYRGNPRNEEYRLLDNDTDEDDYEEDIQRWKNFTEDVNTDLQRDTKNGDHKPRKYSQTGRYKSPTSSSMSSYEKSPLFNRPEPYAGGQGFAWQMEAYPMHLQPSMLPFGEPLQRTMSSPGLYKRFMINEDVPYFYQNLLSSLRPSFQRGRFTQDVGRRLSSSLSNLNTRAGSELAPRTSVCKDSSTQTWLLDRQLTEKDLYYMEEISSSVSSSEKNSGRMSEMGCKANELKERSESGLVDYKPNSKSSSLCSKFSSSSVTLGSNVNLDKNLSRSMKTPKSNNIEKSQNTSSSTDISDNNILQESNCSKPQSSSCLQNDGSRKHHPEKNNGSHEKGTDDTDGDGKRSARSISGEELSFPQSTENSTSSAKTVSQRTSDGLGNVGNNCITAPDSASNNTSSVSVGSENCDKSKNNASSNNEENLKQLPKQSSDFKGMDVSNPQDKHVKENAEQDFSRSESTSGDSHFESLNKADPCNNIQDNTKCKDGENSSKGSSAKSPLCKSTEDKPSELKGDGSLDDSKTSSNSKSLSNSKTMNNSKPLSNSKTKSDSKQQTDSKTMSHSNPLADSKNMSDSKPLCVSEKSGPLTCPHNDKDDDTSIMTDLSLGSSVADISNQSSNFSDFFTQRKMEEDRMEDPDKDRDCHDEQTMEDEVLSEASREQSHTLSEEKSETNEFEGIQGRRYSGKLQKQKTMPSVVDFEPFAMVFDDCTKPPVFSEVQETEDEDDLSTLDSCSVTLSNSDEIRAPTSRREETRKRRQALQKIFRFLDVDSLLVVAQVCREWKKVSRNRSLWKRVVLENKKCSSKFLISLSNWCTSIKHLTLKNLSPRDQRQTEADDVYQSSIRGSLEMGLERLLQVCESTLLSLSIVSCGTLLTDKSIWLASCYSRMLRSVEYLSSSFPLGPDVMYALGAGCRDITTLKIHPIYPCENEEKFSNKCLQIVSQFCSDLEVLSIGGSKVDINGLVLVAKACPRLQHLELHHCQEITSDVAVAVCRLGLKQLLTLAFIHTTVTSDALKHFYKSCKHLKDVQVALFISDFNQGKAEKEDTKLKKWQKFVKDIKSLERIPGLGNILKLSLQNT